MQGKITFDEFFIEFTPQEMTFILQCDAKEDYSFIPNRDGDFCAMMQLFYEKTSI